MDSFDQIAEAMYSYIKSGVKKLIDNELSPTKATIFISGNRHKGEGHGISRQIFLQRQTRDIDEIWSQIHPHLKEMYQQDKKYKKCGIIFNDLQPENIEQLTLFSEPIDFVAPPTNEEKKWEMRQEYISQKYTTSWDEIPQVFV